MLKLSFSTVGANFTLWQFPHSSIHYPNNLPTPLLRNYNLGDHDNLDSRAPQTGPLIVVLITIPISPNRCEQSFPFDGVDAK